MNLADNNLYYVGGVVRDELLGISCFDTDLCYEGDAVKYAKSAGLHIIKINPDFGTVRVLIDGKETDIASTRTETYPRKGHLPKVKNIGCPLKEDLVRRDFTINAMAKRTTNGEITDCFNGIDDIKNKLIRILHKNSFIDDPTRIIRGLKFSVRFGFELEEETKNLQNEYLENINYDMSYHRIRKELTETFNLDSAEAYDRFTAQGIYKLLGADIVLPDLTGQDIKDAIKGINGDKWFLYIAPILCINKGVKLPLKRKEKRILEWTERLKNQSQKNNTPIESIILKELL